MKRSGSLVVIMGIILSELFLFQISREKLYNGIYMAMLIHALDRVKI